MLRGCPAAGPGLRGWPQCAVSARAWPGVESAESEEDFGSRFADAVRIVRGAGLLLGGVLAFAATSTAPARTFLSEPGTCRVMLVDPG